ncbi:MAG: nucleotidyltransferase family protein [Acidimicrobiia bacterium]
MTDQVVILARGLGTRMRRADPEAALSPEQAAVADTGLKALLPVADRPFLDYVLAAAAEAGLRRACLVVGPEHKALRKHYGSTPLHRLELAFAVQEEPRGTADALAAAEQMVGDRPFLALNSDNYYPAEALRALCDLEGSGVALFERKAMGEQGNIPPERISRLAVAVTEQGFLRRIIEKPDPEELAELPPPILVSMNCWRFDPEIFRACRAIGPSARGELELPDAVQYAIDVLHHPFQALTFALAVLDLSGRSDLPAVAARLAAIEVDL